MNPLTSALNFRPSSMDCTAVAIVEGLTLPKMLTGVDASLTVMFTTAVVLPPEFDAVTVKVAAAMTTEGMPEMTPVIGSSDRPTGSAGDTEYEVTLPPNELGVLDVIAVPVI